MTQSTLVEPHGGVLVDRIVARGGEAALRDRARGLPALVLDAREPADLELIATGAASPLDRASSGRDDYRSVLESPAPGRRHRVAAAPHPGRGRPAARSSSRAASRPGADGAGRRLLALLRGRATSSRATRSKRRALVYGTEDAAHPGVAYLLLAAAHAGGRARHARCPWRPTCPSRATA